MDQRPTLAAPDDDPYLWLEQIEGARATAWVEQQNARTIAAFGGPPVERDAAILAAIFDRPDKIPFPGRRGRWLYNFWTDAAQPRGLWRRTTAESFAGDAPAWDVLIDLDALATEEGETEQHLARRGLRGADALTNEREDDDDPNERRRRENDRRQHAEQREDEEDLERGRERLVRERVLDGVHGDSFRRFTRPITWPSSNSSSSCSTARCGRRALSRLERRTWS